MKKAIAATSRRQRAAIYCRVSTNHQGTDRQVVELTMVIGYYHYVSALLNTFEVALPEGVAPLAD